MCAVPARPAVAVVTWCPTRGNPVAPRSGCHMRGAAAWGLRPAGRHDPGEGLVAYRTRGVPARIEIRMDRGGVIHANMTWRNAPQGRVANLAMQLMSALHESTAPEELPDAVPLLLAHLRAALQETEKKAGRT